MEPLPIAICDIGHFKAVNDNHGHDAGYRVIKAIAEALARISDDRCHVARHGGEEFVLLFRGVAGDGTMTRLDSARASFARPRLINRKTDVPIGHVTFSGGLADAFGFPEPRAALAAADEARYVAKTQGRNQIRLASRLHDFDSPVGVPLIGVVARVGAPAAPKSACRLQHLCQNEKGWAIRART